MPQGSLPPPAVVSQVGRTPVALAHDRTPGAVRQPGDARERSAGWLDVDLVRTCFVMGEGVDQLFKAVRKVNGLFEQGPPAES
ncbi:MAG: hypothetical protein ACI8PZ_000576 [Myxococcota bacterium]|jgi:hypothetical protein